MINLTLFLNDLKGVDKAFFIVCAVIIALIVGIYFLIPVFNKKQYQEQRDNLRKREEAFKSNLTDYKGESKQEEAKTLEATKTDNTDDVEAK